MMMQARRRDFKFIVMFDNKDLVFPSAEFMGSGMDKQGLQVLQNDQTHTYFSSQPGQQQSQTNLPPTTD
jgi:hypothetical protein